MLNLDTFKHQLSTVKSPIDTSSSLPWVSYSNNDILELEKQHIFKSTWLGIGRADQWQQSGDFSTFDIVGIPIIVLRDAEQQLKAYINSCRHRGAKLLDGNGACQVIRCPFHRWTYALDGRLLTAPKIEKSDNFDYRQYGLEEIHIEERHGFAFISLNDEVAAIDDYLGDFSSLHSPWQFDDLVTFKRHQFDVSCNWKAFLEVFNEYYHLPYVHPDSINSIYLDPGPGETVSGNYASQFGATDGTGALLETTQEFSLPKINSLDEKNANGARYSWIFPNMTFAAGTESVWVYEAYPLSSQTSRIALSLCFPLQTTKLENFQKSADYYFERLIAAIDEDIPALENQQLGLNSEIEKQGRFHPLLEPNVANFAFWYAKQFREWI